MARFLADAPSRRGIIADPGAIVLKKSDPWRTLRRQLPPAGFADQPHKSREFTELFGWQPRLTLEYLRRIEHQGVAA